MLLTTHKSKYMNKSCLVMIPSNFPFLLLITIMCLRCIFLNSSTSLIRGSVSDTDIGFSIMYGLKSIFIPENLVRVDLISSSTGKSTL